MCFFCRAERRWRRGVYRPRLILKLPSLSFFLSFTLSVSLLLLSFIAEGFGVLLETARYLMGTVVWHLFSDSMLTDLNNSDVHTQHKRAQISSPDTEWLLSPGDPEEVASVKEFEWGGLCLGSTKTLLFLMQSSQLFFSPRGLSVLPRQ